MAAMLKKWKTRYSILLITFIGWNILILNESILNIAAPFIQREFGFNEFQLGVLLSAANIGYVISQIPGGVLSDKFGARWFMVASMLILTTFTSLFGFFSSIVPMFIIRLIFGIGQGFYIGAFFRIIGAWFPDLERGRANSAMFIAQYTGAILSIALVGLILPRMGWRWVFLPSIIFGILISLLIIKHVHNTPNENPKISKLEIEEISCNKEENTITIAVSPKIILKQAINKKIIWKFMAIWFFYDMALVGAVTWLPQFLVNERGLSLGNMALITICINLAGIITPVLGGGLSDKLFKKNRKMLFILSSLIGLPFIFISFIIKSNLLMTGCFIIATVFLATASVAFWAMPITLINKETIGTSSTIINVGGQIAAMITPAIIGALISKNNGNYIYMAYFLMAGMVISAIVSITLPKSRASEIIEPNY